jgi:excisionase family DNA binding protein
MESSETMSKLTTRSRDDLMSGLWLTAQQAAQHIGAGVALIYDACATGGLKHVRLCGKRNIRLRQEWVDAWMAGFVVNGEVQRAA